LKAALPRAKKRQHRNAWMRLRLNKVH